MHWSQQQSSENLSMALCKGCQIFKDRIFDYDLIPTNGDRTIDIHESFEELSLCAESCCDMCKYLRREIWYSEELGRYSYRHWIGEPGQKISIDLEWHSCDYNDDDDDDDEEEEDNTRYFTWRFDFPSPSSMLRYFSSETPRDPHIRGAGLALDQMLDMGRGWLAACKSNHSLCESDSSDDTLFLPTRLLDVGLPGQQSTRLVCSTELGQNGSIDYVTLSYCWGTSTNTARTTRENLAEQLDSIPMETLPLTIQDAIQVTRAFGLRYLWVDALCILQVEGSENRDWQTELPNIGRIYRHSVFTIAASSAKHSNAGLFFRTEPSSWPVQDYHLIGETHSTENKNVYVLQATSPRWNIVLEKSALSHRGWVLQERMSASRTLFFSEEGLFWQCNELKTSEYSTPPAYSILISDTYPTLQQISAAIQNATGILTDIQAMHGWSNLLERYSEKELTVPTDRLPAMTGLLSNVARASGVGFSFGTLDCYLLEGLDWRVKSEECASTAARLPGLPSWSWASSTQAIAFETMLNWHSTDTMKEMDRRAASELSLDGQQVRLRTYLQKFRVHSTFIMPRFMGIEGSWRRTYFWRPCACEPVSHGSNTLTDQSTSKTCEMGIMFDTPLDRRLQDGKPIICILWKERWDTHVCRTSAMVVEPVEGAENMYRRIGWAELEGYGLFQVEPSNIILV